MKKKILVTGGSGFIGTNIVEFYKDSFEVLNIDVLSPRNSDHTAYWKKIDILDKESLNEVFSSFKPDFVLHMAAKTDLDGETLEDYNANIKGVENIIEATNNTPSIKKIIFASSRLVCEIGYEPKDEFDYRPSTVYGESKIIGEKIVRSSKIENANWIIVRPTSLWGPWFGIPDPEQMRKWKKNGELWNSTWGRFRFAGGAVDGAEGGFMERWEITMQLGYISGRKVTGRYRIEDSAIKEAGTIVLQITPEGKLPDGTPMRMSGWRFPDDSEKGPVRWSASRVR